jgi:hypothetical protein
MGEDKGDVTAWNRRQTWNKQVSEVVQSLLEDGMLCSRKTEMFRWEVIRKALHWTRKKVEEGDVKPPYGMSIPELVELQAVAWRRATKATDEWKENEEYRKDMEEAARDKDRQLKKKRMNKRRKWY